MTDLPAGWAEAHISEVVELQENGKPFQQGWSPQCESRPADDDEWGVVKTTAIQHGEFWPHENKALPNKLDPKPLIEIRQGDILMTCAGPRNRCGVACLVKSTRSKLMMSGKMYRFRPHPEVLDPQILSYFIGKHETQQRIDEMKTGISDSGLNLTHGRFALLQLPIPPLNEQRRIADKIEAMFERIEKGVENLRDARRTLGIYRQSLLKSAFEGRLTAAWRAANPDKLEDPKTLLAHIQSERDTRYKSALEYWQTALADWRDDGEEGKKPAKPKRPEDVEPVKPDDALEIAASPDQWAWTRPSLVADPSTHSIGIGPFGSNLKVSDYATEGVPLIFVRNITKNDFNLNPKFVSPEKARELDAHSISGGDVLITKMGDPPGDCAIYPVNAPYAIITADCLKFRVWDQFAERKFIAYIFSSSAIRRQLGLITQGVAQKKISVARFKTVVFPLPSIPEQTEITRILDARLDAAVKMEAEIDAALARADALRQSILKRAFAGDLVPQDPTDEPAPTLLTRIKAERTAALKIKTTKAKSTKPAKRKTEA
jgi:type I restriction enzyme S subunit